MPGRVKPGVGGIVSCGMGLLPPGVNNVRPRLLGFRRGGVGGFTKAGDSIVVDAVSVCICNGRLVVDAALGECLAVTTARFLRLRPFLGGGCFCSSKKGALRSSAVRGLSMPTVNVLGGGDSGDDPGEGSVALESSTVDMVVVGDESFEPVVFVESLRL